jgi:hypothetical protein
VSPTNVSPTNVSPTDVSPFSAAALEHVFERRAEANLRADFIAFGQNFLKKFGIRYEKVNEIGSRTDTKADTKADPFKA